VREGSLPNTELQVEHGLHFDQASRSDIDELLRLQRHHTRASLNAWMAQDRLCFIARQGSHVVALMWADLDAFNYPPAYRKLSADEAYLFAAIADPDYRGRNVAPALRQYCYDVLRKRGITRFYSYTDYLNSGARRFKAKLNARETELRVSVDMWSIWSGTLTLRRF